MYVQQLYTNCLSEAAYYIESNGECTIIDPLRDIEVYVQMAKERNATIKYIFETHFHADFVSGHLDLSRQTGAPIVYGPNTVTQLPVQIAKDGEVFSIGDITIEVLHTPGHTLESSCYLLKDEKGNDYCIFTGDTLFVGDVGRPDLAQGGDLSMHDLAAMLYDSLQQKIKPLADHVLVYPAHGPGSSCGKNLGPNTFSTIGEQKAGNYALQSTSREEFIKAVKNIVKEKGISEDVVFEGMEQALTTAYKKNFDSKTNVRVDINRETGEIKVYSYLVVVDDVDYGSEEVDAEGNVVKIPPKINPDAQIILEQAEEMVPGIKVGETIEKEVTPKGTSFTIRKFKEDPYTIIDLIKFGTINLSIAAYLWLLVESKMS